jgi:hypothetical protein
MKNKSFLRIAASALFMAFVATSFAQNNLGAECGCPAVSARSTVVNLSSLATAGVLNASTTLTCDKMYILDTKIYVPAGMTLTINPGTVIKGSYTGTDYTNATALIIERGGKIMADGTESCPIVFTAAADPMDGSYALTNVGQWGGVAVLGTATNNLKVGQTYCYLNDGVGFVEGFSSGNPKNLYGAGDGAFPTFNDNDNSGILRYVKIKHAGALLADANELNGLSLGSVGRGTTIEHIEIVANADDNIELFGGTVNLKYISTLFGDDDMFDWDLGWNGKAQFLFGMAGDSITGVHSTDSGFEMDGDDGTAATGLRSNPKIYNATVIGNGHIMPTKDNTGPAGLMAKELTAGEIYNSIFAGFRSGLHVTSGTTRQSTTGDAYDNWTNGTKQGTASVAQSLKVKNNTFIGFGNRPTKDFYITKGALTSGKNLTIAYKAATAASADDITQFTTTDGNSVVASIPGFDYNWAWNASKTGYESNPFHATPTSNIVSSITPPADGFFSVVNYRGAFDATKSSWLSEWASNQISTSQESNPTDLNNSGKTDIDDFLILNGKYNQFNK